MPLVIYISADEAQYEVEVPNGSSIMEGAVENMIEGIVGECGGACTCGTCHCYVDAAWIDKLDPPGDFERDLLEIVIDPEENSRLSCQIKLSDELNGLIVRLPKAQI